LPEISAEIVEACYAYARRAVLGELTEGAAVEDLVTLNGMNKASATDYVRVLRTMLAGRVFNRTLNTHAAEYYLNEILKDFGILAAKRALSAFRLHVSYYNGLGQGRLASVATVCDVFESRVEASDEDAAFEIAVDFSASLPQNQRQARLATAKRLPDVRPVVVLSFRRNPDVVAEVLERANGHCEDCSMPAPFNRKSDGTPFLEVHHLLMLAHGGEDVVENAKALCPNCHRRQHYG